MAVLDAADGRLLATWPTGPFPAALALNPGPGRLYVQNEGDNTHHRAGYALRRRGGAAEHARLLTDLAVSSGSGRLYAPNWVANAW